MKYLIFTEYYRPERFLIDQIAEELVREGHTVTVITGQPNYNMPGGRVPKEYRKVFREELDGVEVRRCRVLGRGTGKLRLLLNYFSYVRGANRLADAAEDDYDAVFCYQLTPVTQLEPAIRYAKKHGKRLVCYCLDLAPFSGEKLLKHFPLIKKIYAKKARRYYEACDEIAVTSEAFIPYMQEVNGIDAGRLRYLPQHASMELLDADLTKTPNGRTDFLFAGNIGGGAKLGTVIDAVAILKEKGIGGFAVHIVGDGSAKSALIRETGEKQLSDLILFHDAVPMKEMPAVYASADALLVTLRRGQLTVPGKVQAYMSTGKCILGAMDGSGRSVIETSGCGLCAAGEDAQGLADIMERYLADPAAYAAYGENGRRYFREHFTLETFMRGLTACLNGAE